MKVAILTFDAFNEIDSFVAFNLLSRLEPEGWRVRIAGAGPRIVSGRGVEIAAQAPLEFAAEADAVIFGSGRRTDEIARD
ncbi:MAG: AraC family transcriptional regulator, partial [Tagaea sp.]|nr:AraC family transcriptional regulator [Tagaea sp.]